MYENVVVEFFANAKVIAGTVETVVEMRDRLSGYDVPFRTPSKKKEIKIEFRLLHDVVAKELCAKAWSFDIVTSEKFNFMVAIISGLKMNWAQVLFQVLVAMVNNPNRQSQGFAIQLSVLLEGLVKADLRESVKLHPQKVLTNKSVQRISTKIWMLNKLVNPVSRQRIPQVEQKRRQAQTWIRARCVSKRKEVVPSVNNLESSDSESKVSLPLKTILKKQRTKRTNSAQGTAGDKTGFNPDPIPGIPAGGVEGSTANIPDANVDMGTTPAVEEQGENISSIGNQEELEKQVGDDSNIPEQDEQMECRKEASSTGGQEERMEGENQTEKEKHDENISTTAQGGHEESVPEYKERGDDGEHMEQEERCNQTEVEAVTKKGAIVVRSGPEQSTQLSLKFTGTVLKSAWEDVSTRMATFDEWVHCRTTEIARQCRDLRALAGLPIVAPEASIAGDGANIDIPQITFSEARKILSTRANPARPQIFAFEFSTQAEQEKAVEKQAAQQDEQIEEILRNVENIEETATEKEHLGSVAGQQTKEQPTPEEWDQHQHSSNPSGSSFGSSGHFSSTGPSITLSYILHLGPNPSNFQIIVHTANREENNRPKHEDTEGSSQYSPQQVQSMDSRIGCLDSKVEQLLNVHTFLKHDFNTYKRAFYENMDTMAGNVTYSQKSLETSFVRHLTEHRLQLSSDLDFVKLQLAELVNHLKEIDDAKKGEGGQSSGFGGPRGPSSGQEEHQAVGQALKGVKEQAAAKRGNGFDQGQT
ncbi:hypothetical protein F511_34594 [Dorcoceras hygrometricum]|uniref:Uncharacterized protein n=1 Tax=Dorcoceras hygrometricum TaxID=472368 RepID=A0A2Z7D8X5_9LAMI|nr:hypothetical protein F511_34594 [Dorcoceras hygrometricum]